MKKNSTAGGSRKGAGRPAELKDGTRVGIYLEGQDLKNLRKLKIDNLSLFCRNAVKKQIVYALRSVQKLDL